MRNLFLALNASLALVLAAGPGYSQNKDDNKEDISFRTFDGVLIKGTFYPGAKGDKSPTVMMLHKYGGNSNATGWVALAKRLQEKGYSVLAFDFRGHGLSTTIIDPEKFWKYQPNVTYYAKTPKKGQDTIKIGDFKSSYFPFLLNDIIAARQDLDNRNDNGGCNVSNILVIGAEEGAALGLTWMTYEFFRESINVKAPGVVVPWVWQPNKLVLDRPASEDLAGGVWLSATHFPQKINAPYSHCMNLTKDKLRTIPMWFTYGEADKVGKEDAHYIADILKLNKGDLKIKNPTLPIKGETTLRGAGLLGVAKLDTEDLIEKFMDQMVKLRPNEAKKNRNANEFKFNSAPLSGLGFSGYP